MKETDGLQEHNRKNKIRLLRGVGWTSGLIKWTKVVRDDFREIESTTLTNSCNKTSLVDANVSEMKFKAVRVLTNRAPQACIALRRMGGLFSICQVGEWTRGTWAKNAEKNKYTEKNRKISNRKNHN